MSGFRHEALLYRGTEGFVRAAAPVVYDALDRGEQTLVAVPRANAQALREAVPDETVDDGRVAFLDMAAAGRNPARGVSIWHQFARQGDTPQPRCGISELLWSGRTSEEIVECQHAEAVLNLALAGAPLSLTCAYDTEALAVGDVRDATHHHLGLTSMIGDVRFPEPALPEPAVPVSVDYQFGGGDLQRIRDYIAGEAAACLTDRLQIQDVVLAVNELATNSIRYGGGQGRLRTWRLAGSLVCETSDAGYLDQPLAGMCRPATTGDGGAGIWLVHQVCDLVQVRSSEHDGTVVRLTMNRERQPAAEGMGAFTRLGTPATGW